MIPPDPPPTFSLPSGERPLGIQQPLLPSTPLGQSLLQPKFLTPLGARSLTVLNPSIFHSSDRSPALDQPSPFQDSPFFDPPEPRSTQPNLSSNPSTVQTRALDATAISHRSPATRSEPITTREPAFSLDFTEPSIAQPVVESSFTPAPIAPPIDPQPASVDAVGSLNLQADAPLEAFGEDAPDALAEATATSIPETLSPPATAVQTVPLPDAAKPDSTPTPSKETPPKDATSFIKPPVNPSSTVQRVPQQRDGEHQPAEPTIQTQAIVPAQTGAPLSDDPESPIAEPDIIEPDIIELDAIEAGAIEAGAIEPDAIEPPTVKSPAIEPHAAAPVSLAAPIAPLANQPEHTASLPAHPSTTPTVTPANAPISPSRTEAGTAVALVTEAIAPPIAQPAITQPGIAQPGIDQPTIAPSVVDITAASEAQPATDITAPVIQLRSDSTSAEPAVEESRSPFHSVEPEPAIAQAVVEESTAASNSPTVSDLTTSDAIASDRTTPNTTTLDAIASDAITFNAMAPDLIASDSSATAIEPSNLQATTTASPSEAVVQPSLAEPSTVTPIAPVSRPEEFSPTSLTAHSSQPESTVNRSPLEVSLKEISVKTAPLDVERSPIAPFSMPEAPEVPTPTAQVIQAKREQDNVEAVPEPITFDSETPIDAMVAAPSLATPIDQLINPTIEASTVETPTVETSTIETPTVETPIVEKALTASVETLMDRADASFNASTLESERSAEPSTATNPLNASFNPLNASQEHVAPLMSSASMSPALPNHPSPSDASTAVQPDGMKATTQPTIQRRTEAPTNPSRATLPVNSDLTAVPFSQENQAETISPSTSTPATPDLNASTLPAPDQKTAIDPNFDVATIASSALNEPEREASVHPLNTLPELPTSIQRLSVWEPLVQMQPLSQSITPATVQSATVQSTQTEPYQAIPASQAQLFDRQPDRSPTKERNGFASTVSNEMVSLQTEAAPTDWSNIAELLQSVETSQTTAPSATEAIAAQGYTDLNLRPESTALPNTIQREMEEAAIEPTIPAHSDPVHPETAAHLPSAQPSPSSQQQQPNASPEQFERLAQEVYRLVRQRLALERERVGDVYTRRSI